MKKIILPIPLLLCFAIVSAQSVESPDSLTKNLDEILVSSPAVIRKVDKNIYQVNDYQKQHSSSTLELLRNMQIPQLSINTVMESVASSLGEVQIRINGREASVEKLKTINKENIQRIEWVDNPGLRYGTTAGAVLNIVTVNPSSGGSLNLSDTEALDVGFNNGNALLTLNYGASQWTIGGWFNYRGNINMYREYNDSYRLPDGFVVERTQSPLPGYFGMRYITPMVGYNYVKPDTTNFYVGIYHTNGFNNLEFNGILTDNRPESRADELLKLSERSHYGENSPSIDLYLEQKLARNQTLVFSAATRYSKFDNSRRYAEGFLNRDVENINIENTIQTKAVAYSLEGNYIKNWGRSSLTAGLKYTGNVNKAIYRDYGNRTLRQTTDNLYFFAEYAVPVKTLMFTAGLGGTWNSTVTRNVASTSSLDFTPRLSVNWRTGDRSRWNLTYNNIVLSPSTSNTSPITQEIDGIQIERGNPDLHSYQRHRFLLGYSYSNNAGFSLSLSERFTHSSKPIQSYYTHEKEYILRSYSNDGFYNALQTNLSLSWEAVKNWLSISADIDYKYQWNRGHGFRHTVKSMGQTLDLAVYHWNFTLDFQFYNPTRELNGETVSKGEKFNILSLDYSWKHWNFQAALFMAFGRYSQETEVIADLVKQKTIMRSRKAEHMPMLTVSYNINWGAQKRAAHRKISGDTSTQGAGAAGR